MTTRTIDNDFRVVGGNLVVPTGIEAVRQRARQHLLFILGESFRSPDEGTPYFFRVLGTFQDPALSAQAVAAELETAIEEITNVEVIRFGVDPDTRTMDLNLHLRVSTIFGNMDMEI